jgi:hypothetical protein
MFFGNCKWVIWVRRSGGQYSSFPYPDRIRILEFDAHGETLNAGHIPYRWKTRDLCMNRFTDCNQEQFHQLWLAKTVSDVAISQNVSWVGSVVLQFLTDLTDENANIRAFVSEAGTT